MPPTDATPWHTLSADEALARLASDAGGLPQAEAEARLARHGPNELRPVPPASAWEILLDQLKSVVVLLLVAAAGVALLMGDVVEAAAIFVVLLLNTALGFTMEVRARRAMEALRDLEVPRAAVLRDGHARDVDARTLVPGDVLLIEEGGRVPADAYLLQSAELLVVEAALTGESLPVPKRAGAALPEATPLAERVNLLFSSTFVAAGSGRAVVARTGMDTEVGRIGRLVGAVREEPAPLERRLDELGRRLVWIALAAAALVSLLGYLQGVALAQTLETGIALAIAAVPEGLPAVATIALAVGVRRMARRRALVRRLPVVESLGSATVVCTDKTGTLTAGEMTVTELVAGGRRHEVTGAGYEPEGEVLDAEGQAVEIDADAPLRLALTVGALANRAELLRHEGRWTVRGDPTEGALLAAAWKAGLDPAALAREWPEAGEVPFSSARMLMATFHRRPDGTTAAMVKGAPGRVAELCARVLTANGERPLDDEGRREVLGTNEEMAGRGLRVLALAWREDAPAADASALGELTFVGLAGIMDPPAEGVPETVAALRAAGIRTVMITGDQRLTAFAVGRELGIVEREEQVVDGRELQALPAGALSERLRGVGAFSRVSPEDKLRIVEALQRQGEIVAMLGDGVNDAAALKKADVGVAMGLRGTDVAKEAAAVVLQDDRFATVGAAVEEGRVIFGNVRKFVFYLFSCNLAEILVLLIAALASLPSPLMPLQILWMNLVTDTLPALALAVEPADAGVMREPPRDPREAILSRAFLARVAAYGALITAAVLAAFGVALSAGDEAHGVTVAFVTLALAQTFHLGNARSAGAVVSRAAATSNPWALRAVIAVTLLQVGAVYFAPLARVLHVTPLSLSDWLLIVPLAAAPAVIGQAAKLAHARRVGREPSSARGAGPAGSRSL